MERADSRPAAPLDPMPAIADDAAWRRLAYALLALAAILFFARLGMRALWASEFRWGEISREMRLTGNYLWPTINGRVYYDKPLGSYWLVVASAFVTGGMNEAAARLPCAIAGLIAVAFLILLARRLYDLRTGVAAGLILATSFSFVFFSRSASADVATITGELAAILLFLRHEDRPAGWWLVPLWLVMAVTSQMKGLLGFVLPIVVIGSYCTLADGWAELGRRLGRGPIADRVRWVVARNRWFFNWKTPVAAAIGLAVYYLPFALSRVHTGSGRGLYMVYRENVQRYFEPFDHRGPIYLYTYVIFALMAPWSIFLPAALAEAHQRRRVHAEGARSDRFTLVFFWATFAFFTLSGSRRSYYLLPIVPAAAILVARILLAAPDRLTHLTRRLIAIGFAVFVAATALAALTFISPRLFMPAPYAQLPPAPDLPVFAIFWLCAIAAIVYVLRDYDSRRLLPAVGAATYLFMIYFFVFAMPAGDAYRSEKPFAKQVLALIGNDASGLALFKNQGPIFYLNLPHPVPEYDRMADLNAAISAGRVHWLIVRRRDLASLTSAGHPLAAETLYPWDSTAHGLNTMVLVPIAPASAPPSQ
ncbi:MAG: glycosyltransferase family 39 protein [Candidatus Binataceae bacterium]|nr:glycosyltransferase family 39 protein [Candidatus Binataceae bacterium]